MLERRAYLNGVCDQFGQMSDLRHLFRFCLAATLLVVAMLLAPTDAYAHAGHDHGPVKVQSPAPASPGPDANRTQQKHKGDLTTEQSKRRSSAVSAFAAGKSTNICTVGCCHTPGHSCCAAALLANLTLDPRIGRTTRLLTRIPWGPGVMPGALPEPPKYPV